MAGPRGPANVSRESLLADTSATREVLGIHRLEELAVRLGRAQLVDEELDAVLAAHWIENAAQHEHLLEIFRRNQQIFLTGAGLGDVDRREHTLIGDLAVKHDFRVTGALEFFEDDFVHARTRYRQAPSR